MSKQEWPIHYNEEFYKLAKMSLPEIKEYIQNNYTRSKANFFIKYKLQQYAVYLSSTDTVICFYKKTGQD